MGPKETTEGEALVEIREALSASFSKQARANLVKSASSATEEETPLQPDTVAPENVLSGNAAPLRQHSLLVHRLQNRVPEATSRVNPGSVRQRSTDVAKYLVPAWLRENANLEIDATTLTLLPQRLLQVGGTTATNLAVTLRAARRKKRRTNRVVAPLPPL